MTGDEPKRFCARSQEERLQMSLSCRGPRRSRSSSAARVACACSSQGAPTARSRLATAGRCFGARTSGLLAFAAAAPLIIAAELWSGTFGLSALGEFFGGSPVAVANERRSASLPMLVGLPRLLGSLSRGMPLPPPPDSGGASRRGKLRGKVALGTRED